MSSKNKTSGRLLALDVLRGITIAGMLLVNNPGSWAHIYAPLRHAPWNGLTPTDLVFPFFMFIMGFSSWFALRRYDFRLSWSAAWKITRRGALIFAIGLALAWFGRTLRGVLNDRDFFEAALDFSTIRLLGVLPRLGLCYFFASFLALIFRGKSLQWLVGIFLAVYALILLLGDGYSFSEENIIYIIDNKVIGAKHLYADTIDGITLKLDPEGLVSTLPSIAHALIGFICASIIMQLKDNRERIIRLFIIGTALTFSGFLLSYGLPINKKIWSPTFVLTTCGLASLLFAMLIWVIDIKGRKRWCRFFEVFGINPLFLFCLGSILAIVMGAVKVPFEGAMTSLTGWVYEGVLIPIFGDPTLASLVFALVFVIANWAVGLVLYKKKIYIKI